MFVLWHEKRKHKILFVVKQTIRGFYLRSSEPLIRLLYSTTSIFAGIIKVTLVLKLVRFYGGHMFCTSKNLEHWVNPQILKAQFTCWHYYRHNVLNRIKNEGISFNFIMFQPSRYWDGSEDEKKSFFYCKWMYSWNKFFLNLFTAPF